MPKSVQKDPAAMSFEDAARQNKKQAKREAKLMLKLSQAKADVEKAEKKVTRAQTNLEASRDNLHKIEARLSELRQPGQSEQEKSAEKPAGLEGTVFTPSLAETGEEANGNQENKEYQSETSMPNLTSDQPELSEKPADASHSYSQDQYEAGDTEPYPTGQGGWGRSSMFASDSEAQNANPISEPVAQETSEPPAEGRTDTPEGTTQADVNATTDVPASSQATDEPVEGRTDFDEDEESATDETDSDNGGSTTSTRAYRRRSSSKS